MPLPRRTRHQDQFEEIQVMKVGGCLIRELLPHQERHALSSAIYFRKRALGKKFCVRVHFYERKMFVLRIN
jgi:hypothetical protein